MSSDTAIRLRNLSKVYRIYERPEDRLVQMATLGRVRRFTEFSALSDVSLDIRRGETIGIVGRNGCGKSTLLQIVCGTLQPTTGTVEVSGRIAALLELGAGFNGEFTGRENVYMNGAILGFGRDEMDARFDQIAAFAGIGDFIERPVKTYSSGMFVRLAFAVATAVEPEILVVDEALSVGDEAFQRKCFARIEAIKERGGTILFVSHSAQTVVQLCDRAVLLDGGEKILEGRPKRVTLQYQRLVNASAEAAPEIRASIIAMGAESAGPEKELPDVAANPLRAEDLAETSSQEAGIVVPTTTNSVSNLGTFDPNLKSQSMVSTEERGARIHNARIVNLNGEEVNILQMERRYIFEFDVEFASHARQVSFGMAMRTQTGVILAGASSRLLPVRRIDSVAIGHVSRVQFEFTCLMLPGVYFLGCSVFGQTGEDFDLMHRIVDALAFRVAFEQDILAAGFFDISPQLTVKQL